ncbi:MAG: glycoside hydrolase [Chloroflexota bacterium]|nr:glycoside hydrolase [Chloroflexota bacterium]
MIRGIRAPRRFGALSIVAILLTAFLPFGALAADGDVRVNAGSPTTPFSQNKQNEPALAVDAHATNVLVAGANDNIDMEACNAGNPTTCPFTDGVGVSGVYFSFDSGATWTQPTYQGWTARDCLGPAACVPHVGPIGTLPGYFEAGLQSDGDPAVAFGPRQGTDGRFSWSNGSRLYYANLTANFGATRSEAVFKGFEAIAVSRTDDAVAAAAGDATAWQAPVIVSKQSSTTFSDKEQIWADNASSSTFFGTVYLCWASFRGQEKGNAAPAPLIVANSHDGGTTWTQHQVTAAANNGQRNPLDGCTVRTDSTGTAYVFGVGTSSNQGQQAFELMSRSFDGGKSWSNPVDVAGPVTQPGVFDPVLGRPVIDGIAGARSDLAPAPSVDIANGAPTGADATNRIVMTYVSGVLATPHVYFTESTDRGNSWKAPRTIETSGDRGYYTAPAISPNGTDVYVVYNAFTTPYRTNTTDPRSLVGVFLHADSSTVAGTATGAFTQLHRGAPGDPRGTSQNDLVGEFLGDYVYAVATRTYGSAVWNDARNAADCPAIDAWRIALRTGDTTVARPAPATACLPNFGNSDIFGVTIADPTP